MRAEFDSLMIITFALSRGGDRSSGRAASRPANHLSDMTTFRPSLARRLGHVGATRLGLSLPAPGAGSELRAAATARQAPEPRAPRPPAQRGACRRPAASKNPVLRRRRSLPPGAASARRDARPPARRQHGWRPRGDCHEDHRAALRRASPPPRGRIQADEHRTDGEGGRLRHAPRSPPSHRRSRLASFWLIRAATAPVSSRADATAPAGQAAGSESRGEPGGVRFPADRPWSRPNKPTPTACSQPPPRASVRSTASARRLVGGSGPAQAQQRGCSPGTSEPVRMATKAAIDLTILDQPRGSGGAVAITLQLEHPPRSTAALQARPPGPVGRPRRSSRSRRLDRACRGREQVDASASTARAARISPAFDAACVVWSGSAHSSSSSCRASHRISTSAASLRRSARPRRGQEAERVGLADGVDRPPDRLVAEGERKPASSRGGAESRRPRRR